MPMRIIVLMAGCTSPLAQIGDFPDTPDTGDADNAGADFDASARDGLGFVPPDGPGVPDASPDTSDARLTPDAAGDASEADPCTGAPCPPPPPECVGDTVRTYGDGACVGGSCAWGWEDVPCIAGCADGACIATCGDSVCTVPETTATCPSDCGSACGDGVCTGSEGAKSCDADCALCYSACGSGPGGNCPGVCGTCGDGVCYTWFGEDAETCPTDCP